MPTPETVGWLGVMAILSTGACAATLMLVEDNLSVRSRSAVILLPTGVVGLINLVLLVSVAVLA